MKIIYQLTQRVKRITYRHRFEKKYYLKATPWLKSETATPAWQKAISKIKPAQKIGFNKITNLNLPFVSLKTKPALIPVIIGVAIIISVGFLLTKFNSITTPKVKAFDLTLSPAPAKTNYLYQNITNGFKVYLGDRLQENKPKIKFEQENSSAEFSLAQFPHQETKLENQDNKAIVYKNVLPGIDIKYYLLQKGVKEEIVIREKQDASGNKEFRFNLNLKNAVPKRSLEGKTDGYFIEPLRGEYLFHIPKPFMIDAAGNQSEAVELKIEQQPIISNEGSQILYTITLIPNQAWLQSAVYPVMIDPSVVHDESSEFSGTTNRIEDEGSGTSPKLRIPYHELPADEHTVGLWHMNNSWNDDSGNGNNGTANGGVGFTTSAKLGSHAGDFDGGDDYVSVSNNATLQPSSITIEAWIFIDSGLTPETYFVIADKPESTHADPYYDYHFRIEESSGKIDLLSCFVIGAWGGDCVRINNPFVKDRWYHVATTFDSQLINAYIDGELRGSLANPGSISYANQNLYIGSFKNLTNGNFPGRIDEVRISNIARTAEEIKQDAQRFPYGVYTSNAVDLTGGTSVLESLDSIEWTDNVSSPGASLDGWPNFKPVIIDNTQNSNTLTDHQTKVHVDYDSNMQADFDDLRFTSNTATVNAYGSEANFNAVAVNSNSIATLDSTHFIIGYKDDGGDDYGCAKVGTVTGTSISYGSEYCFNETNTQFISIATLDSTHFIIGYKDTGRNLYGCAQVGTVSGSTISYGSEYCFNEAESGDVSVTSLDSTHFTVSYTDFGDSDYGCAKVGTVAGTTISYGDEICFNEATTWNISSAAITSSTFVVGYQDEGDSSYGCAKVGTVSGSSISFGSESCFKEDTINNGVSIDKLNSTHFVVTYYHTTGFMPPTGNGLARVGTVSGSTITYGTEAVFHSESTDSLSVSALNSTRFVVSYSTSGVDGCSDIGTVSGTSISFGNEACYSDSNVALPVVTSLSPSSFVVGYLKSATGKARVGTVANTNLDYWIEAKSDGVEADVWVEVDTIPASSLTTIWMWYGNGGASAGSNGTNTFVFFDDFNDDSLNGTLWNSAGTVSESGGVVTITNSGSYIGSKTSYGVNYSLAYRGNHPNVETNWVGFISGSSTPFAIFERYATSQWNARSYVSAETITALSTSLLGTYQRYEIERNNGSSNIYYVNNGSSGSGTHTTQVTSNSLPLTAYMLGTGSLSLDWIALRSFTPIEPIVGVGADIEFQTRTSADGSSWEAWKPTTNETQILSMDSDATNWSTSSTAMLTKTDESNIKMEGDGSLKSTVGAQSVDGNTQALWHFEETGGTGAYILDETANNNDGTPTGTTAVDGFYGKGRNFNGTDDYLEQSVSNFQSSDSAGTVEAWIYPKSYSSYRYVFASADEATSSLYVLGFALHQTTGKPYIYQRNNDTADTITSNTPVNLNQWNHIAWVSTGTEYKIYINGQLQSLTVDSGSNSGDWFADVPNYRDNITIGNLKTGGYTYYHFSGIIDEVRISNTARTSGEIAEVYRAGRDHRLSRTISPTDLSGETKVPFYFAADKQGTIAETYVGETDHSVYGSDSNTKGLWHLEEKSGSGAYIKDSSGNDNHGTPTGSTLTQGKIGDARYFNGSSNYISMGDILDFENTDNFSIEAWVKTTAGTNQIIVAKFDQTSPYPGYEFYQTTSGYLSFILANSLTAPNFLYITASEDPITDGKWHHVAATYDGSKSASGAKLYRDGKQLSTTTNSDTLTNSILTDIDFEIGARDGANLPFSGLIDEVRVSDSVRTPDEIRLAYQYCLRTHQINIDFKASLDSGNLIADSDDTSFTVDATAYGLEDKGNALYVDDKVIVKENYNGTNYIAQGDVASVNLSSGATTVASWDSGSTFPSGGYTVNATVFKWQREFWDLNDISPADRNDTTKLGLRILDASEGFTMYLDDFRSNTNYLTDSGGAPITSTANRYLQYRAFLTTNNTAVTPELAEVKINYTTNKAPNTPSLDSPLDEATKVELTPDLKTTATDDDSDYLRYKIELDTVNTFDSENLQVFNQSSEPTVKYYNNLDATVNAWTNKSISSIVPSGVSNGNVTATTDNGTSNGSPFEVGNQRYPDLSGEKSSCGSTFSGTISSNTTWSDCKKVTGDVTINSGVTLTIDPGTTIIFAANSDDQSSGNWTNKSEFLANGQVIAEGTQSLPIYFTSDASSPAKSNWGAIDLEKTSTSSSFKYAYFHYAEYALRLIYGEPDGTVSMANHVENCVFDSNTRGVILNASSGYPTLNTVTHNLTIINSAFKNNSYGISMGHSEGYGTDTNTTTIKNNIFENNAHGVDAGAETWWVGHSDMYPVIKNNTFKSNAYGIHTFSNGSNDGSGADSDVQPEIKYNLFDDNTIVAVNMNINPKGGDGTIILNPNIQYNTIKGATYGTTYGIRLTENESSDTMNPTIAYNIFYGQTSYKINNTTARSITAENNYWGENEANWDAGPQVGDTNGTVDTSPYLTSSSTPMVSRLEPATEATGSVVILHGANLDSSASQTGWSGQDAESNTAYASGTQAVYTVQSELDEGTTYYWRSYAVDPGGSNTWSATQVPCSFTTDWKPTAPTALLTEGLNNPSGVTDTTPEFSAVYNDPDSGDIANKYWIQVDDNSDFGSTIWDSGAAGSSMSNCTAGTRCSDISYGGASTDLQWGTKYYWRIKFWDETGEEGAWSTEEAYFVMDVFKAPTGCHMDDGSQPGQITIKWQDNDNKETGFRIERDVDGGGFALLTTEAVDSTSYLDNTTSVDHTYQYRIRGNSDNGNTTWCGTTKADFSEGNFKFEGIKMEGLTID